MTFLEQIQLMKRLDALIRRKATGKPEQLANRLGISRASMYRYVEDLKALGAPVAYCRNRQSYYYTRNFTLEF